VKCEISSTRSTVPISFSILFCRVTWATTTRPIEPNCDATVSPVQPVHCLLVLKHALFLRVYDVRMWRVRFNLTVIVHELEDARRCLRESRFHLYDCSRQSTAVSASYLSNCCSARPSSYGRTQTCDVAENYMRLRD